MSAHAGKGIGQADNRIDQDADHNDDQQKTCAAAGVETGFDSHVFHRQRLSVLVTENRFMLGPVIGEQPLDVADLAHKTHVKQQDRDPYRALGEIARKEVRFQSGNQTHKKGGQENEEKQRQRHAQYHSGGDDQLLCLFPFEMRLDPLIEFVRLALLLQRNERGGIGQRKHPLEQRVEQRHDPAKKGQAQDRIPIPDKFQVLNLFYDSVPCAADDGLLFRPSHQNAFDQRLPTDGSTKRTILSFSFHVPLRRAAGA